MLQYVKEGDLVPIYQALDAERKQARNRRVDAMRRLRDSDTTDFIQYHRDGDRSYQVATHDGIHRYLTTREVPAYVVGHRDAYIGIAAHVEDILQSVMLDPSIEDMEQLIVAVMDRLHLTVGSHMEDAAAYFPPPENGDAQNHVVRLAS